MLVFRSLLFAPGNHARRVEKSLTLDADAVVLDLEDAVAVAEKAATREKVVAAFQTSRQALGYVRINAFDTSFCFEDLRAVVAQGVDGIVLPKVESHAQLVAVDWTIAALERARGLAPGGIDLMPIIETGRGIAALREIACSGTRVRRLSFGAGDYTLDVGMRWTREERELDHARAAIVVESRAAGLEPPIDTVFIHLGEMDALRRSTELARDFGFQGKLCIHPEQVGPVNAVFTPTDDEIAKSETLRRGVRGSRGQGFRFHPGRRVLHRLSDRGEGPAHAPDRGIDPIIPDPGPTAGAAFDPGFESIRECGVRTRGGPRTRPWTCRSALPALIFPPVSSRRGR